MKKFNNNGLHGIIIDENVETLTRSDPEFKMKYFTQPHFIHLQTNLLGTPVHVIIQSANAATQCMNHKEIGPGLQLLLTLIVRKRKNGFMVWQFLDF